jgi:hypothetical protein
MPFILLLALSATAQPPSLHFKSETGGQRYNIWVWCETDHGWANNSQAIVLKPGKSSRLDLHTGYFVVVVRNQFNVEHRERRVLAEGEVDRLRMVPVFAVDPNAPPIPREFRIVDDN